jgi:hypothetical protein
MQWNEHEREKPNVAGLTTSEQHAEMYLLLAGRWPPLRPLPVFKYETDQYRASIEFDKARGEWVCRKISLPSNKVWELRGGLTEISLALPSGQARVYAECAVSKLQEQELEADARRRLQAIVEWRQNYENGALYSDLQHYLSESQQYEIDECIRLTLTARQLQFNPKNVASVFEALSKAGGKLATLIEIAHRKKLQGTEKPARAEAAGTEAQGHVSVDSIPPMHDRRLQMRTTLVSRPHVELDGTNGGSVLNISETGMAVTAADSLPVNAFHSCVRFQLPGSGQRLEIFAQIVWLADSKKRAGIRFVGLTAEARDQISNWIASEKPAHGFEGVTQAPVENIIPATLERFQEDPIGSDFPLQVQIFSPGMLAPTASQASKVVTTEILCAKLPSFVEDAQENMNHEARVTGFGPQVRTDRVKSSAGRGEDRSSHRRVLEITGFQVTAFALAFLFAVIGLTVGLTVGRGPLGKHLRDAQKSMLSADTISPALPILPGETTSQTFVPPPANAFNTPAVNLSAQEREEAPPESPSARSLRGTPEDATTYVSPNGSSSTGTSRSLIDSDNSLGGNTLDDVPPFKEKSTESTRDSESFAKVASLDSNSSPTTESKPSVNTETTLGHSSSARPIVGIAPPPPSPKPEHSPEAVGPMSGAPRNPVPRRETSANGALRNPSPPSTILVTAPTYGRKPFRVTFPEKPIAASSSFAMTSELSILVYPQPGPAAAHKPARLQAGELVFFVWPRYPMPGDRYESSETVKVRTTIGQLGQVLDTRLVSGSMSLFPAAMRAIHRWRYRPTLLNKRPVQVQQDVTIEFRQSQYLSQVRTKHPSHR